MPLTLKDIRDYLSTNLAPHVTPGSNLAEWLDDLFDENNVFGQLLGLNLYIDLKTGAIQEPDVSAIINQMIRENDARLSFYRSVENESTQSNCICRHVGGQQSIAGDRYVRVLPFTLMAEYWSRSLSLPNSPELQAEMERRFYGEDLSARTGLGQIRAWWRGRMENVWVTSKAALDQILDLDISDKDKASVARTRLGFYKFDVGRLVFVAYPPDFDLALGYVPTSLDANSTSLFFVPIGMEPTADWGETCSLTPVHPGMKERVHRGFVGLTDEFESEIIGYVEPAEADTNHLLKVAWGRVP
jgi:hypothetical protein